MKNTKKENSIGDPRKFYCSILLIFSMLLPIVVQPVLQADATVTSGIGNSLSGINNNSVNISNSGAYTVDFSLSGTLDTGNTLMIAVMDSSGKTATGSFLSMSGGESSGSVLLDLNDAEWREGALSFSGLIYSGSTNTPVVSSGMAFTGILDTTRPGILLSSSLVNTITGATTITVTTTDTASGFTLDGVSITNATATGLTALSATGYIFTITPLVSTGMVVISVGTGAFSDAVGNANSGSNILSYSLNIPDTTAPIITIISYASGATVSGSPTFTGSISDSGGIASVSVNGVAATVSSGTWSKVIGNLVKGTNTITAVATDLSGNTGSTSILVNRIPLALKADATLSGTTSAVLTFDTDLSTTGAVRYGTNSGTLDQSATGTAPGTIHSFLISGLTTDTTYYFTVSGEDGGPSSVKSFKTPEVLEVTTASGSITTTGSVYLSGSTGTGVTFLGSGSLRILSLSSSGSSLSFPFNGLPIKVTSGTWDGVLQAPELTSNTVNLTLSGYAFNGAAYQIGNAHAELAFSGQLATISIQIGSTFSGQTARVFRSTNQGANYAEFSSCIITAGGNCVFTTNQLSLFAFALPADTTPNVFSFSSLTGMELSTQHISNAVTITGINGPSSVSVVGGEYSINGEAFTIVPGSINSGSTIVLRATSSPSYSTNTNTTLTIGGISSTFTLTTKAASSTSGGSGGGGGGRVGLIIDNCSGNDYSPSYYDGNCGTPNIGGGNLNTGGNIITGVLTGSFNIPPIIIKSFSGINVLDVSDNWAQLYILRLVIRGIVDNVEFYRPDANLTRAEFLKIVINATGWQIPSEQLNIPFDDVSIGSWYAPYTSLALSKGMISGNRASFNPNDPITRAEATKILMTALGVTVNTPTVLSFVDLDLESDLTKYIEAAKYLKILSGQLIYGRFVFRPNDSITRSEIAKVVVNAFHL